jgi:hypothetical protein
MDDPGLVTLESALRHGIGLYRGTPDTEDRRRVIVCTDSHDSESASRTTLRSPRWWAGNSNTSAAVTSTGSLATRRCFLLYEPVSNKDHPVF